MDGSLDEPTNVAMHAPTNVPMHVAETHELLDGVGDVRRRARGDRRATSAPLVAFGVITVIDALLRLIVDPLGDVAFLLIGPIGFAAVALYYRHRERSTGVGGRRRPYVIAAVVTLVCLPLLIAVGVYGLVGLGLFVIALRQRNLYLGVWAVVYGVLGGLERFFVLSNRLYSASDALGFFRAQDGYFSWAPSLVYATLGVVLIGAGLYAQRRAVAAG